MDVIRSGSISSAQGPESYFTGTVRIDPMFEAPAPGRMTGALVTFEPGARTAWHSHPFGQTLIVTTGRGQVQLNGEKPQLIYPGDVVVIHPGEKHWHGATPETAMSHIAVQEHEDGTAAFWNEKVSDEVYNSGAKSDAR